MMDEDKERKQIKEDRKRELESLLEMMEKIQKQISLIKERDMQEAQEFV